MKILFMGSIPTFERDNSRTVTEQERTFTKACDDMGYAAARRGHTILLGDNHVSSADLYVAQGIKRYAEENPEAQINIEMNRPEGTALPHFELPQNVNISCNFHGSLDGFMHGTGLLPNLAALDSSDVFIPIGGKLTVRLIGNIGADRDKRILAIPAFGGSSAELYDRLKFYYRSMLKAQGQDTSVLQSVWLPDSAERIIGLAESLADQGMRIEPHSYFISYTWNESDCADHIEVLLRRHRRTINRDDSIFKAGVDLSDVVKTLIQESDTFIALWSGQYKDSTWCPHELEYALNRQSRELRPNRVVILALDKTEVPIRFTGKLRLQGDNREARELSIRRLIEEE